MTLYWAIEIYQISQSGCINISFADYSNKKTFDVKPFNTANTKIISYVSTSYDSDQPFTQTLSKIH